jgi:hypothetical protein
VPESEEVPVVEPLEEPPDVELLGALPDVELLEGLPVVELVNGLPVVELLDELPSAPVTAPLDDTSDRNAWGLGAWMFATACLTFAPDRAERNPIPSGGGITIPWWAASRSIR